jgi:hypothetical protein
LPLTGPSSSITAIFGRKKIASRNDFARRLLQASVAAGIEAPIRFHMTGNPEATATLFIAGADSCLLFPQC